MTAVSAKLPALSVATNRYVPGVEPAVYNPPGVIVPPVAVHCTVTATLSPAWVRPKAKNCCD
jgi:hypothetical protein